MTGLLSANLGLLWTDLPVPDAVRAAAAAGFGAVEFQWPYDTAAAVVRAALEETGLPAISLNAPAGDLAAGDFGLAALPGRAAEALEGVDQAIAYADAIGARFVHVLAGRAAGAEAREALIQVLRRAVDRAAAADLDLLIEPKNSRDVPGYHLTTMEEALAVLEAVAHPRLRIMFDCYHMAHATEDVAGLFARHAPLVAHVQIAGFPGRRAPDTGDLDYVRLLQAILAAGYSGSVGAEYVPRGAVEAGLGWMPALRGVLAAPAG
ncbi:MAG: TIM barrel protein [Pseudomonadota bacterium]